MNPKDILDVAVVSVNSEGEGIARTGQDNFIVFIPGALPGERVRCRITRTSKKYAAARVLDVIEASPARVEPKCPSFGHCGGCQLQHASYAHQLEMKARILSDALTRIGRVEGCKTIECFPSPKEWGYRNKTILPVRPVFGTKKAIACGYYERRTHRISPFEGCAVLDPLLEKSVKGMIRLAAESGLTGYDEASGTGDLRHIAARIASSREGQEVLTALVVSRELKPRDFGRLRHLQQLLAAENPAIVGSVLNIKTARDNFVWGPLFRGINGKSFLRHTLSGYRFDTDISTFFQVNALQAKRLFERVRELQNEVDNLLELYCGVGGLTAYLSSRAQRIDAVEEWAPSVRLLKKNLEWNRIENVDVHRSSAEDFMKDTARAKRGAYDAVVLDPPRTGCDESVIEGIKRISPRSVIYVSCNPATLARDVLRLSDEYSLESVEAFDMFPQTSHVEAIVLLSRLEGK